jgi:antitoxin PrlF
VSEAAVNSGGQIDLPAEARAALHLGLVRSVDVEVLADGVVLLRGRDPGQSWYWSDDWQAGEREADDDMTAGRSEAFDSDEEFERRLAQVPLDAQS